MIPALKPFSRLVRVPASLSSVTVRGEEISDVEVGLKRGSAEELWRRAEQLYATGVQPGMQLCVRHGGQVILNRAIGHARGNSPGSTDANPVRMRLDTPTNLFSAGKAVTALLMHKLEELGALSLDDRVSQHIPEFARHGKGGITLRQVITHRAGIARLPQAELEGFDLSKLSQRDYVLELMCDLKPGPIGGAPAYHAISGGFVLAEVMHRVTGQHPRELLNEHIKQPLGLRWLDFGVTPEQLPQVALNATTGFLTPPIAWHLSRVVGADFDAAVSMSNDPNFLTAVVPSGNVIATAEDCATLYQCLLNGGQHEGKKIFAAETVRRMREPDDYGATLDRVIGIPIRYSRGGFMIGHTGLGLYGWNRHDTFGHLGLSCTLTWARPSTGTVISWLTTGKPILGPHIPEIVAMFMGLNALCENRLV